MADVFISYSKAQRSDADLLAKELQAEGYSVWWDSDLISGDNFTDVILSELDKARAVIVIWSPTSVKSDWVRSEANRAHNRGVLIPVRAPNLVIKDIPPPFDLLQTVLVTNSADIHAALARLIPPGAVAGQDRLAATPERAAGAGRLASVRNVASSRMRWAVPLTVLISLSILGYLAKSFYIPGRAVASLSTSACSLDLPLDEWFKCAQ